MKTEAIAHAHVRLKDGSISVIVLGECQCGISTDDFKIIRLVDADAARNED